MGGGWELLPWDCEHRGANERTVIVTVAACFAHLRRLTSSSACFHTADDSGSHGITAYPLFGVRSMRKLLLALFAMFFMAGLVVAVEVSVLSYDKDKKEIKVKEGDAEKTYKVDPKGKFTVVTKDGDKDSDFAAFEKRAGNDKAKGKIDITVKDGTVTEAKWKGGKKN
jgi:hypothetical protein